MASVGDGVELTARKQPTILLVSITVVGLLVGALGLLLPGFVGTHDEFAADRQSAITRASDFAVTFNTYSVKKKADYQRRVKPLMTKKYYGDFIKITNAMFAVIKNKNQSSGNVQVLSTGIESIDKDSAVAIVALNSQVHRADSTAAIPRRYRWEITMQKVGGKWLVSDFNTVPAMEATIGDVTSDSKDGGAK